PDSHHACGHAAERRNSKNPKTLEMTARGFVIRLARGCCGLVRLLPKQHRRQHQEKPERPLQVPRRHGHRNKASPITAQQKANRAVNSGAQVHLAILPILQQSAQSNRRQQNKQRRSLSKVLVIMQQVHHRRHQHHTSTNAQQSHEHPDRKPQQEHHENHGKLAAHPPNRKLSTICVAFIFTPAPRKGNDLPDYSPGPECELFETFPDFSSSALAKTAIVPMLFISLALGPALRTKSDRSMFPSWQQIENPNSSKAPRSKWPSWAAVMSVFPWHCASRRLATKLPALIPTPKK